MRFYVDEALCASALTVGETVELREDALHHALVRRVQPGEKLVLFNGLGGEFVCAVAEVGKRRVAVQIQAFSAASHESPLHTVLGQAMSTGERMDWVVQKATELGVSVLQPLMTERCELKLSGERAQKKHEHWQRIAISACEQCGRNRVPQIAAPLALDEWLAVVATQRRYVLSPAVISGLPQDRETVNSVALLVGPEGGLSDREIARAVQQGFQGLQLGPRVLRTETAPVAALALVQSLWGDWR